MYDCQLLCSPMLYIYTLFIHINIEFSNFILSVLKNHINSSITSKLIGHYIVHIVYIVVIMSKNLLVFSLLNQQNIKFNL